MSYEFYKTLHLFGILLLFTSLGGVAMLAIRGGAVAETKPLKRGLLVAHGVSMLVIFTAGFGLMARRGMMGSGWPAWIFGKLAVWLVLGASVTLVSKRPGLGKGWYWLLPVVGVGAAALAVYKPT